MTRMSSPDGSEIVTVNDQAGQVVLSSLGWSRESGSRSEADTGSETGTRSDSGSQRSRSEQDAESTDEAPRRRGPGRPRKQHSEDTERS